MDQKDDTVFREEDNVRNREKTGGYHSERKGKVWGVMDLKGERLASLCGS